MFPVLRQGNVIALAAMPLDVAEACSGIRSLLTLVTLAIIYGYLWRRECGCGSCSCVRRFPSRSPPTAFAFLAPDFWCSTGIRRKPRDFTMHSRDVLIFVVAMLMLFAVHRLILPDLETCSASPR